MSDTRVYSPRRAWYAAPVAVVAVIVVVLVVSYNGLVGKQQEVRKTWAEVDNMLQRRGDLIPNLVSTVKGYAAHEQAIFDKLAEARKAMQSAGGVAEKSAADAVLRASLAQVTALAESTPAIKADAQFQRLMDELAGSENRIAVARTRYNEAVRELNGAAARFPGSIAARFGKFPAEPYFEAAGPEARKVPKVGF